MLRQKFLVRIHCYFLTLYPSLRMGYILSMPYVSNKAVSFFLDHEGSILSFILILQKGTIFFIIEFSFFCSATSYIACSHNWVILDNHFTFKVLGLDAHHYTSFPILLRMFNIDFILCKIESIKLVVLIIWLSIWNIFNDKIMWNKLHFDTKTDAEQWTI